MIWLLLSLGSSDRGLQFSVLVFSRGLKRLPEKVDFLIKMDLDDATARLRRLQQQHYDETTSWQPSNNGHAQNGHQEESIDPQLHEKPLSFDSKLAKSSFDSAIQLSTTEPRALPDHDVTDETIDDAYVAFIFYCNPAIPVDTDASELRTGFRASPKSDGKQFSIFKLFELIRKLELKELKTWVQLALELGVEPPALDKGQSAQKVQQYAVRLKVSSFSFLHSSKMNRKLDGSLPLKIVEGIQLTQSSDGCTPCMLMPSLNFSCISLTRTGLKFPLEVGHPLNSDVMECRLRKT